MQMMFKSKFLLWVGGDLIMGGGRWHRVNICSLDARTVAAPLWVEVVQGAVGSGDGGLGSLGLFG